MRASGVEEGDVASETAVRLADGVIKFQIDRFVLYQAPQPFDEGIVAPATATADADAHLLGHQSHDELGAGELRAPIAVTTLRAAKSLQRLQQCIDAASVASPFRAARATLP